MAHIATGDARRIVILGPVDAGKSTFARLLRAALPGSARLDADPGQGSVGPPACVALARGGAPTLAFVGTTDPIAGWARLVAGVARLAASTRARRVVVNTDGLLAGPGPRVKAEIVEAAGADLLVAIGEGAALDAVLGLHPNLPVLRLASSAQARRKRRGERRSARREGFARYFAGAAGMEVGVQDPAAPGWPEGLLLGLLDGRGGTLGLGLLLEPPSAGCATILARVPGDRIHRIVPGALRLDSAFDDRPWRPEDA